MTHDALAGAATDGGGSGTEAPVAVQFGRRAEHVRFRRELRAWLAANHPGPEPDEEDEAFAFRQQWQRDLYLAGWIGLTCPKEWGGQGLTAVELAIFNEELVRARAPRPANLIGLEMGAPTILSHGTAEQKARFIAPLLAGDEIWCQAFSEPQAGSDLSAIKARAWRDGEDWVVSGQKIWTSFAHEARWCMLLVRTDPESRGYSGLSYLLLDMLQPGVTVRRIDQITGEAEFNEVFFDEARVPVGDMLGGEGDGWKVAITTLMHERANLAFALAVDVERALSDLVDLIGSTSRRDDPVVRDRLAQLAIEAQILRITALQTLLGVADGRPPGPESSLGKWRWAEINQAVNDLALDVLGASADAVWTKRFLRARANSIEGGTTEILKNVVAERVLGLPRGR